MKRTIKFATVGALSVVTVVAALVVTQRAGADGDTGSRSDVAAQDGEAAVARSGGGSVEARAGGAVARAGDGGTEARTGVAQEESSEQSTERRDGGERGEAVEEGQVLIKIEGDEGVEFFGTCTAGGEEETLEGQVPREFTFELGEEGLECEISKEGAGALKVVLVSGNDRIVQRVSGDSTLKLAYSGNGSVSSSTSSTSGSSGNISQSSSVTQSSSSSNR